MPIETTTDGPIAQVTLSRPEARNALNLPMCLELTRTFETLDADPTIRVILIAAKGPVFCAGADMKERTGQDEAWVRNRRLAAFRAYDAIERCRKPVIALLEGPVVGSGGEIALAADFAIATPNVTFRFPEPQWGTVGATQRLQRAIGKRRAKDLLYTARPMPAEEALATGLIARLVPPDQLEPTARQIAQSIAKAPPLAIALTKQTIDLGEEVPLQTAIRIELAAIDHNLAQGDWRQGLTQFATKP